MTQSNERPSNGNGQKDFNPSVEYEYLDSDVWIKDTQGSKDVAYTEDVLNDLEEDDPESPSSNGND